jgi:two-component system, NtrC family, sensor kinase
MKSLAEAACELPWLAPCAGSLVALTQPASGRLWSTYRSDPGLVLLLLRQNPPVWATSSCSFYSSLVHEPGVLHLALQCLREDAPFVDWCQPALLPVYRSAISYATAAEALALASDRSDPEHAWVGGLLAPLGWLAAAIDAERMRACLKAELPSSESFRTLQLQLWGLDHAAIARRLALAWRLPAWLTAVAGHLGMPLDVARGLGAEPDGFRVVQLAVALVDHVVDGLKLPVGASREELMRALDLTAAEVQNVVDQIVSGHARIAPPADWKSPGSAALLPNLLQLAADNRKLTAAPAHQRLHAEVDALHEATRRLHAGEEKRLQERKLCALAELAAGAGHEINNPLAVISGQAQYLLVSEQETARKKALQTIIGQTQRIHQTLTQLMQFARPPAPHQQRLDLGGLLREVTAALQQLADDRQVRVLCTEPDKALTLLVDPGQIRTILVALLRNAIEAAPPSGWASLNAQAGLGLTVVVEDNGCGPSAVDREHLFDPFYSGRKAGRGRGLGLPTAWQLARQHGGEVAFDTTQASPTRFVLTLPSEVIAEPLPTVAETSGINDCHHSLPATSLPLDFQKASAG